MLPHVAEIVRAHRAGDAQLAEEKMVALRREVRNAERRLAALQHAVSTPMAEPESALRELLTARTELHARVKRKLEEQP